VKAALAALAIAALAPACRPSAPPAPPSQFLAELLALGEANAPADRDARLRTIDTLVARARARMDAGADPAAALAAALFEDLGYQRDIDDRSPRATLLRSVLDARRGGCVGLGTLFLAAAERAQIPAAGVLVPGHFFVTAPGPDGRARNVELLRRGEEMPAAWYRQRYGLPPADAPVAPAYLRPLTPIETLAVVRFNLGNDRRAHGDLPAAAALYARAAADFPQFAEAHASLGLTRQLQHDLDGAAAAYAAAQKIDPALPGLEQNLAALAAARAAAQRR